MELVFWSIVFIVSLAILIKSSDYFTESAEKIGISFGMSPFVVGVTIVAIGTSLPELISSLFAIAAGSTEIITGNVVGSNIANIFLILGVAAVIAKKDIIIGHELINVDLPLLVGSAFMLTFMLLDGSLVWWESIILLLGLVVYVAYTMKSGVSDEEKDLYKDIEKPNHFTYLILLASIFGIFIGAKYTIDSVLALASLLSIGAEILALSVVALGTSLPELAVTISAAKMGKSDMAVGNILGSNIFNTFAIMGISGLITPILVTASLLSFAIPVMVGATLLYFFITQDKHLTRYEGWMLILFYVFFFVKSFA